MKSLPLLFLGIFFMLAFSWTGLVLSTHIQLKDLRPATPQVVTAEGDPVAGPTYEDASGVVIQGFNEEGVDPAPVGMSGQQVRGMAVYNRLGCMYCHSQQVRRPGYGSDYERGWGARQSVPRDYILQPRVFLGTSRTGPDLANVGLRYTATWQHQHLFNPQITSPGSNMPPFPYLYVVRPIDAERGPSPQAVPIPPQFLPGDNYEVVPTRDADDLVAYLLSLQQDYDLPEIERKQ